MALAQTQVKQPPLAPGRPVVGHVYDLLTDPLKFFLQSYLTVGPVYRAGGAGRIYTVLAGPKANRFLMHGGEDYLDNKPIYKKLVGELQSENYPIGTDGEQHKHLRKTLKPAFSREAISHYIPKMTETAERIVQSWKPDQRLPVNDTMQFLVGEQLGVAMADQPIGEQLDKAVTFARFSVGAGLGGYPGFFSLFPHYKAAKNSMFAFMKGILKQHREQEAGKDRDPDLVDLLLGATTHHGQPFNESDVVANAQMAYSNSMLYAAPACAFLLYELLRNPDVLAQVRAELDTAFRRGIPDVQGWRRMTALHNAAMESMRLHPIALATPRIVVKPFEFEGYVLEPGTPVLFAVTVCHYLPEIFPEPTKFDITRYVEPRNEHRQSGMFVPFGMGSHVCLGAGLVEILIMTTVAAIIRNLDVQLEPTNYKLKKIVNPFPEPEGRFSICVVGQRTKAPIKTGLLAVEDEKLSLLLPDLNQEQLAQIAANIQTIQYQPGDVIIRQGDQADHFFIITSGEVEVMRQERDNQSRHVATLRAGEYFGEIGLLQGVKRTATVQAVTNVSVMVLNRETFTELVAESDLTSGEISKLLRHRMMSNYIADALPKLSREQVARMLPRFEIQQYNAGENIIRQGDQAEHFYVITKGRVEIVNQAPNGQEIWIGELEPGEYFGEMGLLQRGKRTATVRAEGRVEVLALDRDTFSELIAESQQSGEQLSSVMSARLKELISKTS